MCRFMFMCATGAVLYAVISQSTCGDIQHHKVSELAATAGCVRATLMILLFMIPLQIQRFRVSSLSVDVSQWHYRPALLRAFKFKQRNLPFCFSGEWQPTVNVGCHLAQFQADGFLPCFYVLDQKVVKCNSKCNKRQHDYSATCLISSLDL